MKDQVHHSAAAGYKTGADTDGAVYDGGVCGGEGQLAHPQTWERACSR